jgi:chitodextrinase
MNLSVYYKLCSIAIFVAGIALIPAGRVVAATVWSLQPVGSSYQWTAPGGTGGMCKLASVSLVDTAFVEYPGNGSSPAQFTNLIPQKYPDYSTWATAQNDRLLSWGFNAAGMYSGAFAGGNHPTGGLPYENTEGSSGYVMDSAPYVKDAWHLVNPSGMVCGTSIYQGQQADPFDPNAQSAYTSVMLSLFQYNNGITNSVIGMPEEADFLFGLDTVSGGHADLAYIVAAQNPMMKTGSSGVGSPTYADATLYAKLAMRDYLAGLYGCSGSADPAAGNYCGATAAASSLAALNTAWGTSYTTWNTSSAGGLAGIKNGTYASWGTGTGFLDENGTHILSSAQKSNCGGVGGNGPSVLDNWSAKPQIKTDTQDYVAYFAKTYAQIIRNAYNASCGGTCPPMFMPIYDGPSNVFTAMAPYVDGFWVNPSSLSDLQRIIAASSISGGKSTPIIIGDYSSSNPDSPWYTSSGGSVLYNTQAAKGAGMVSFWQSAIHLTDVNGKHVVVGLEHWPFYDQANEGWDGGFVSSDADNPYDGSAGIATANTNTVWQANHTYTAPSIIYDGTNYQGLSGGLTGSCKSGASAPSWAAYMGSATSDGTCTWRNEGPFTLKPESGVPSSAMIPNKAYGDFVTPVANFLTGNLCDSGQQAPAPAFVQLSLTSTGGGGGSGGGGGGGGGGGTTPISTSTPGTGLLVASTIGSDRVGTATSESISLPTVSNGNIVLVQLGINTTDIGSALDPGTIVAPSGYHLVTIATSTAGGAYATQAIYWHLFQTGDPTSVTFQWTNAGTPTWTASTWTGINTSSPIDTFAVNRGSSRGTSITIPSINLASTNNGVIAFGLAEPYFGNNLTAAPSGFTTWQTQQGDGVLPDLYFGTMATPVSPTGNATVAMTNSVYAVGITVALNASGSSAPPSDTTPPTVSLTSPSNNATVSSIVSVAATASDNVGVTKVEFYLDGALKATDNATPFTWSWNTASSTNGSHTLSAKAYDAAGNSGVSTNVSVTVSNTVADTAAPSVPGGLTVGTRTPSTIAFSWTASTDNVGVSGYQIFRNSVLVGTTTLTSFTNTGLAASTTYSLTVAAYDAAGNTSAKSSALQVATQPLPDTTAPTVTITSPANHATVSGPSVTFSATASDNVGVKSVQFQVDGVNYKSADTASPYQVTLDTTALTNGSHTLGALAKDAAGNQGTATILAITVSNLTNPTSTPDTAPPSVPTGLVDVGLSQTEVGIAWTLSTDDTAVTGYQIFRNSIQIGTTTVGSYTDATVSPGTTYNYSVDAYDGAGNISAHSAAIQVTTPTPNNPTNGGSSGGGGGGGSNGSSSGGATSSGTSGGGSGTTGTTGITGIGTTLPTDTGSLSALLSSLLAQVQSLIAQLNHALVASFTRDLTIGSSGSDVKNLQVFLNDNGYPVSTTGAGASGNESLYFGGKTAQALARFQATAGLPATGYFGPLTRQYLGGRW